MREPHALLLSAAALAGAGCAHAPAARPATATTSPDARLIAAARAQVDRGEALAEAGLAAEARTAFDAGLDLLLTAPGGARAGAKRASAFEALLRRARLRERELVAAARLDAEAEAAEARLDETGWLPLPELPDPPRTAVALSPPPPGPPRAVGDFPVEANRSVRAAIALYEGRKREWFARALRRAGRYLDEIDAILVEHGLPRDLAWVPLVESAFRPEALSRARARGLWQFIPATGRRFGLAQDFWVDERSDPTASTRAAARYLSQLHDLFGDWNLALAAYNCGERRVERAIRRHGTRDFWRLARLRALPRETRQYVPLIHAAIAVASDPERHGFAGVVPEPPERTDRVAVSWALDLRALSDCAEVPATELRRLNPALRRASTSGQGAMAVRVPAGRAETTSSCLASLPPESRLRFEVHVVRRGQTLSGIARRYGVGLGELAAANGRRVNGVLPVGTRLIVPRPVRVASRRAPAPGRAPAAPPAASGGAPLQNPG